MNRAVKFKLKNGETVIIRRLCDTDYEPVKKYYAKFNTRSRRKNGVRVSRCAC